ENEKSFVISFDVKFTDKSQSFEVLLVDSDGGKKELPWTKRYLIGQSVIDSRVKRGNDICYSFFKASSMTS
ncbi:MAG: hypothetical protein II397_02525, partial [Treponema sp.]|nr:hypothetical protein [Treponema sp.]